MLQILGRDRYGAMTVAISLIGWCSLLDFGLAGSLQNFISEMRAAGMQYRRILQAALLLGALLVVVLSVLNLLVAPLAGKWLFGRFALLGLAHPGWYFAAAVLVGSGWTIAIISFRIWLAEHRGYTPNVLMIFGYGGMILGLVAIRHWRPSESFFWCIIAYMGPMTICAGAGYLWQWIRLRPTLREIDIPVAVRLTKRGMMIWVTMLLGLLSVQSDYFIMSRFVKPAALAQYGVAQKVQIVPYMIYSILLSSSIPMLAELTHRGEKRLVRREISRLLAIGVAGPLIFFALCPFMLRPIGQLFATKEGAMTIPLSLMFWLCLNYTLRNVVETYTSLIIAVNELRFFFIVQPMQVILSIGFQILFVSRLGAIGSPMGMALSFALTFLWLAPKKLRSMLPAVSP